MGSWASWSWRGSASARTSPLTHPRVTFTAEELARPAAPLPKGFLWGTATAAHQIEGGNTNDWTRFEAQPGAIERGETSAVSADHWNRMAEDVALMKAIRANAYRFSIEWSRLEPQEGAWNEEAWARYGDLVRQLREAGITPAVTLLHFTLPLWMADRGGVAAPDFPDRFARFAAEAGRRLGPGVDLWITLNEPNVQMYMGYVLGAWPPQKKSPPEAVRAFAGLLRGHAAAAAALRAADPGARIGVANNVMLLEPKSRLMLGRLARVAVPRPVLELGLRRRHSRRAGPAPPPRGDPRRAHRRPRRLGRLLRPQLLLPLLRAPGPGHAGDVR